MRKGLLAIILLTLIRTDIMSQDCSDLGQNPGTAFPVCGKKTFSQAEVKLCGNRSVPGPCDDDDVTDKNPYWYKFKCYTSGTLGFLITPVTLSDDYDWQLFDITGRNPEDVYNNKNLFVACNWSGESGVTGASSSGSSLNVCAGFGQDLYSAMPTIHEGREYLLLISHFTNTQSGYTLEFTGGTADITDPTVPALDAAYGACSGNQVMISLNKAMQCSSLSADGSEFEITSGAANVIAASAPACASGFDMDSVVLTLDRVLPPGTYTVRLKQGADNNTLLDACEMEMSPGSADFTVHADVSAAFQFTRAEGCQTDTVHVIHDGANNVNFWNWQFDGLPASSQRATSMVYYTAGEKNITLEVSNGHCSDTASVVIAIAPKIDAAFSAPEIMCKRDPAAFLDRSTGAPVRWVWDFGNGHRSTAQNPDPFHYNFSGANEQQYRVKLNVTAANGCTDSAMANVIVVANCNIVVPSAFTPNNDGRNDKLYPSNAFNATDLIFRVFNRFGQLVFETRDAERKWDGTLNGVPQAAGTYVWTLTYVLKATGRRFTERGTTVLIR